MTNEETVYMPNTQGNNENTVEQPRKGLKTGWKRVAIGGVSGVMIGSAAAYAATHFLGLSHDDGASSEENADAQDNHKMAQNVNDDMAFEDAFAAAREEVGPGGVFTWRGNVYGTFTTDEWEAMTPQEQMDYFASISGEEPAEHLASAQPQPQPQVQEVHHYHHTVVDQPAGAATAQAAGNHQQDQFVPGSGAHSTDDNDVHVVATTDVQQVGQDTYAQGLNIDGHAAVAIGDQQGPDVVIVDINDNLQIDPNDVVIDLNSDQVGTMGDFVAQMQTQQSPDYFSTEYQGDMPDNDVDPGLHEVDYEPSLDPTMDPTMDAGLNDPGLDMATDVPVFEC